MAAEESARRAETARRAELERLEAEELAARRAEEAAKAAEENERRAQEERRAAEEAARIEAEAQRVKEADELARVSFYVMFVPPTHLGIVLHCAKHAVAFSQVFTYSVLFCTVL